MRRVLVAGVAALVLGAAPVHADPLEDFGTVMKYGLPLAAAVCAADQNRLADFAVRGGLQMGIVLGLKRSVGGRLGLRPTGLGQGFPSGHASSAAFGAADLAGNCIRDNDAAKAGLLAAALLTSFSRVEAGEHTPAQAAAGTAIGFILGAGQIGVTFDASF